MAQTIDLDGLPGPVAKAIVQTVLHLKSRYQANAGSTAEKPLRDLPSRPAW